MSTHRIVLGPGDDVITTGENLTQTKVNATKTRTRVKDNRTAPVPAPAPSPAPVPAAPIVAKAAPGLDWDIRVVGGEMTARQILVAGGGGATFAYEPPPPPPPPDPDPDPEDPPDPPPPAESAEYEGYGSQATGGLTPYSVTNLNDSGSGSLRNALASSTGQLHVTFAVQGNLTLLSQLKAAGDDNLIDGSTAPGGGITLRGAPIWFDGRANIIVRQLRFRDQASGNGDGLTFTHSQDCVIDHCSFQGAADGQVDITQQCQDVSLQWCILGPGITAHNYLSLIGTGTKRVSVHHNLFYGGQTRQPQAQWNDAGFTGSVSETVADVRCNLVWSPSVGLYGSNFHVNAIGNAVRNYYNIAQKGNNRAIHTETGGSVYAAGNYVRGGSSTGHTSRSETSVPAYAVVTMESTAQLAAAAVIADAGCRVGGLASWDQAKIDAINAAGL